MTKFNDKFVKYDVIRFELLGNEIKPNLILLTT